MQCIKCIFRTVLLLFPFLNYALCAKNVLVLDGMGSPSHQIWMHQLTRGLANHGYNVTSLTRKRIENAPPNLHMYFLDSMQEPVEGASGETIDFLDMATMTTWEKFNFINDFFLYFDEKSITANGFHQILNFPEEFKFDLIVYDLSGPRPLLAFADRFPEAKLISASAYPSFEYKNFITRSPNFPAFHPNIYLDGELGDDFYSRLESFIVYLADDFMSRYNWFPKSDEHLRGVYQTKRTLEEIAMSTKIQLVNYHPVMGFVAPIMPSVISVGGLQIEDPKPLPKELEDIFAKPSKGVVLFSLGTNVKSEMLGEDRLKAIINVLAEFPDYTFLWKIDLSKLNLKIPRNVFIKKWLPQNDILADNRTRLFISHAGGLSTQECTWYGQPMLALPVMIDQFPNARKAVKSGMAIQLDIVTIDKDKFKTALLELLTKEKYSNAAKLRSRNFRDQKETPMERALWWVDYVLRNPDVSFLKNPKLEQMNYFVKHSMDVIAFLTIIGLVLVLGCLKMVCWIVKNQFGKQNKVKLN